MGRRGSSARVVLAVKHSGPGPFGPRPTERWADAGEIRIKKENEGEK